jgi:hypothetical protein
MQCWQCGQEIESFLGRKIPFRAECEKCMAALHSCIACKFYLPGRKNDCMVPGTEFISERKLSNLCEEFVPHGKQITAESKPSRNKFDDLFK